MTSHANMKEFCYLIRPSKTYTILQLPLPENATVKDLIAMFADTYSIPILDAHREVEVWKLTPPVQASDELDTGVFMESLPLQLKTSPLVKRLHGNRAAELEGDPALLEIIFSYDPQDSVVSQPMAVVGVDPTRRGSDPAWLAMAMRVIGSPRSELVEKLYEMMNERGVIQVRGTPASGKTTLSTLLYLRIREIASSPVSGSIEVYWVSRWDTKEIASAADPSNYVHSWEDRLRSRTRWPGTGEQKPGVTYYLLLDEAQLTYWDLAFWNDFIKPAQNPMLPICIALFCAYGSSSTDLSQGTPPIIGSRASISLQPPKQTQREQPTLLLVRNEYDEMLKNRAEHLHLDEPLQSAIYDWTSGHVGAIDAILSHILQKAKMCMAKQMVYTLAQFGHDWPSFGKFTSELTGYGVLARSLPNNTAIRDYALTFRRLIQAGFVDISQSEESGGEFRFTECHRRGWIYAEVQNDLGSCIRYSFPSPLHRSHVSWFLTATHLVLPDNYSLYDLAIEAIRQFTPSQVQRSPRKVAGGPQDSAPEALYQNEFYRAILKRFDGGVGITPEFASASGARVAGRIDFFVHQTKWGIECMRDGDRLQAHSDRFADDGAYGQWLTDGDMKDYILLDFRGTIPTKKHLGIKHLYHVVFSADGNGVAVYDNKLSEKMQSNLLAR